MEHHHHLTPDDWTRVANEPPFRALIGNKRRFVIPATIFSIAYYLALPALVGFAPTLAERTVWGPVTVANLFALSQFAMAWILLAVYLWRARGFDATEATVVENVRNEFGGGR
ncbi:MAG: DUF485 domain-containing protein [Candidatus Eremiobacteraeota bacterium]|nr:DUF485 domain-containing protein [Candidatus Eremiobacteraeota bacterium]